jgi:hypothetical protein
MDFFQIRLKEGKKEGDGVEVYPEFQVKRSDVFMVQSGQFYAVWDPEAKLWSRDHYRLRQLVDAALHEFAEKKREETTGIEFHVSSLLNHDSGRWEKFLKYAKSLSDNSKPLDTKVMFANTEVKKSDHASRRLPYSMAAGESPAYTELVSVLYDEEERRKFEWAIGAIIDGAAKRIQKFLVFHGKAGTGKSTVMEIIDMLFGGDVKEGGYVAMFEAQSLVGGNSAFGMEAFRDNPLVAIQHDGDLSKIEDNSRLNSIVSHERMKINEKFKATYDSKINAMLFMGTNKPVQISDAKSGLVRRIIDVYPTGKTLEYKRYLHLMEKIKFELGQIAHHCLGVYRELGSGYYKDYEPTRMMLATDPFLNFVEATHDVFKHQDGTWVEQAWELYKKYNEDGEIKFRLNKIKMREALQSYFETFEPRGLWEGEQKRGIYRGFKTKSYKKPIEPEKPNEFMLVLEHTESLLDEMYAGAVAQYAKSDGSPAKYWTDDERMIDGVIQRPKPHQIVDTVLGDLNTKQLHFLKLPEHHIVIDFDLEDGDGNKSLDLNLKAASSFPATYAELSKSGNGVHLHYFYDGDTKELANVYADGIEVKVYRGNSSLRRRLSRCNDVAVATISSGLPFREKKPVLTMKHIRSEDQLRAMIIKNVKKGYHPGTKPSIDFIKKILDDAADSPLVFDVSDMRPIVMAFANESEKNALYCLKVVTQMTWTGEGKGEDIISNDVPAPEEQPVVFFDIEIYPNLFLVCWKEEGEGKQVVRMVNPTPGQLEGLMRAKLVGFNNRSYDNHILMAAYHGATVEQLYQLSQRIIVEKDDNARYPSAWNLSYADVYDFSVKKQSLKKWEIELGLRHMEMDIPWDEPVPADKLEKVAEYCTNDVLALEAVWYYLQGDFEARKALAALSGLTVNQSTRKHCIQIIFGKDKNPQREFVYTDLSKEFPGYTFDQYAKLNKSTFMGENVGEGGYVYAEPGIYHDVALLDVASMHPTSIIQLNLFGKYTENFKRIYDARLAIKGAVGAWAKAAKLEAEKLLVAEDIDAALLYQDEIDQYLKAAEDLLAKARKLLPGIEITRENAKALAEALKLVINSIYGYTAAKFDNPFRDKRNIDNIVAKRGALFMVLLKHEVQKKGFPVAHIKTDSIKIPGATPEIIKFVSEFGAKYGYNFEHEATYDRMCLVNDAVYVAKYDKKNGGKWTATGAEFKHPYVFKTLFTGEQIYFPDLCETKQVSKGAMNLRFAEGDVEIGDYHDDMIAGDAIQETVDPLADLTHVGRSGSFVPIKEGNDEGIVGGELLRILDGKAYAVGGTKGYKWAESDTIRNIKGDEVDRMMFLDVNDVVEGVGTVADFVDMEYYTKLAEEAVKSIEEFGDFKEFVKA